MIDQMAGTDDLIVDGDNQILDEIEGEAFGYSGEHSADLKELYELENSRILLVKSRFKLTYETPTFDLQSKESYIDECNKETTEEELKVQDLTVHLGYTYEFNTPVSMDVEGIIKSHSFMFDLAKLALKIGTSLKILKLINCEISPGSITILGVALELKHNIQYLYLDGNPNNAEQNYDEVLCKGLKFLSLKFCDINDDGVNKLAMKLDFKKLVTPNHLTFLDLTGNNITCRGAKYLAEALRWNRTLKNLILTGNKIRNKGASALAHVLTRFRITEEENKLRHKWFIKKQKLIEDYIQKNMQNIMKNIVYFWAKDDSKEMQQYRKYLQKITDFSVQMELVDVFGINFVRSMNTLRMDVEKHKENKEDKEPFSYFYKYKDKETFVNKPKSVDDILLSNMTGRKELNVYDPMELQWTVPSGYYKRRPLLRKYFLNCIGEVIREAKHLKRTQPDYKIPVEMEEKQIWQDEVEDDDRKKKKIKTNLNNKSVAEVMETVKEDEKVKIENDLINPITKGNEPKINVTDEEQKNGGDKQVDKEIDGKATATDEELQQPPPTQSELRNLLDNRIRSFEEVVHERFSIITADSVEDTEKSDSKLIKKVKKIKKTKKVLQKEEDFVKLEEVINEDAEKDVEEGEIEEGVEIEIVSDLADIRSADEMCTVTSSTEYAKSNSTWSSFGVLPGKEEESYNWNQVDRINILADIFIQMKRIIENLHEDDPMRGELFNHEMKVIYEEIYNEALTKIPELKYPILKEVDESTDVSFCYGNFTLRHLNLSYNRFGLEGLKSFLKTIKSRRILSPEYGQELTFLFKGNNLSEKHEIYKELQSMTRSWPPTDPGEEIIGEFIIENDLNVI